MTTIVTRTGKGSPLTHVEVDTNFTNLNTAKLEAGAIALGSAAAPSISFTGDTNTGIFSPGADTLAFAEGGVEAMRIDSSGRLLVGTSSSIQSGWGGQGSLQLASDSLTVGQIYSYNSAGTIDYGSYFELARARGTKASPSAVLAGDGVGELNFYGYSGGFLRSASIRSVIESGTISGTSMPGRLVFSTTADGASSPTERLTINSVGRALYDNSTAVAPGTDDATALGLGSFRWSAVYAANGTIQTSDERAKTSVENAALGADFIKSLRPVSYKWIEGGKRHTGKYDENNNFIYEQVPGIRTHWGFIAQEVKEAVDAAGVDFGGWVLTDKDDPDSQQALRYDQFIAPLTKALQEALAKIETLEAKVAALEAS